MSGKKSTLFLKFQITILLIVVTLLLSWSARPSFADHDRVFSLNIDNDQIVRDGTVTLNDFTSNFSDTITIFGREMPLNTIRDSSLGLNVSSACLEKAIVRVLASDSSTIEKVEFYVNGTYKFTDFSKGFEWELDTNSLPNGEYTIGVVAYNKDGGVTYNEEVINIYNLQPEPPSIDITAPLNNSTVTGANVSVNVTVSGTDSVIDHIEFYVDGEYRWTETINGDAGVTIHSTYYWNTYDVTNDEWHTLSAKVFSSLGASSTASVRVYVENFTEFMILDKYDPSELFDIKPFKLTRSRVLWTGSYFSVNLTIKNTCFQELFSIYVVEEHYGFQAFLPDHGYEHYTEIDFNPETKCSEVKIRIGNLRPGESKTIECCIVPILYAPDPRINFKIGKKTVVKYLTDLNYISFCPTPFNCTPPPYKSIEYSVPAIEWSPYYSPESVYPILPEHMLFPVYFCDYLVVTHPKNLYSLYNQHDVSKLLSEIANFSVYKKAALGYLTADNEEGARVVLKNAISRDLKYDSSNNIIKGGWNLFLNDYWPTKGYLLIVGETEIVPSHNFTLIMPSCKEPVQDIPLSDHYYSDINNNGFPDVIVGRIIGDNAKSLLNPIRVSLGVHRNIPGFSFDSSDALLISGAGEAQSSFVNAVNFIWYVLHGKNTNPEILHWKDYSLPNQAFNSKVSGKDIIYFTGHGNPTVWGPGLGIYSMPSDFGGTNPVAFATSCSTGRYEWVGNEGEQYDSSIAEAFLDKGAGVYIGATRMTNTSLNNTIGMTFFKEYWDPSLTIGESFFSLQSYLWGLGNQPSSIDNCIHWRREVLSYNIYGDPKYLDQRYKERYRTMTATAAPISNLPTDSLELSELFNTSLLPQLTTVELELPNYNVSTINGFDYVDIPGGQILLVHNQYRAPFYIKTMEIPEGYTIQNVALSNRSGLIETEGLNLPIISLEDMEDTEEMTQDDNSTYIFSGLSFPIFNFWYPEEDFRWTIVENGDGSSTLELIVYPFYVNILTKEIKYYTEYEFDIDYVQSFVELSNIHMDNQEVDPNEIVGIYISLSNSNNSRSSTNVILSAEIRSYVGSQLIDTLESQSLSLRPGRSSTTMYLNTGNLNAGHYVAKVLVSDESDNLLDSKTVGFKVGKKEGEISNISATPLIYHPGEEVTISMSFTNTGSMDIKGAAKIMVKDSSDEIVAEFLYNFSDLKPDDVITFNEVWETSSVVKDKYCINGFVFYDGKCEITQPITVSDRNIQPLTNEKRITMELPAGWSLISLPVIQENTSASALFPNSRVIYQYEKDQGYVLLKKNEVLEPGRGYWILSDERQSITLTGQPIHSLIFSANEDGWYIIGGCTYPARVSVNNGRVNVIYQYVPGIGYKRLSEKEDLVPGGGYWISLSGQTNLTISP